MQKEAILNLSTKSRVKESTKIKINCTFRKNKKRIKIKKIEYYREEKNLKINTFTKSNLNLKSIQHFFKENFQMKIKNNPYIFYLVKYKILNPIIINNIIQIVKCIKIHLQNYQFEKKIELEETLDNLFLIIKFNDKNFEIEKDLNILKDLSNNYLFVNEQIIKKVKEYYMAGE